MLRTSDNETEILLGNKQLLGIFFAVAILLAVAFYGGYMVGRGSASKKAATAGGVENSTTSGATQSETSGQTRTLPADSGVTQEPSEKNSTAVPKGSPGSAVSVGQSAPNSSEAPLGTRKHKQKVPLPQAEAEPTTGPANAYTPEPGSEYLQVVAISKSEAEGLADVLHKKGFRAHAVPKPGSSTVYRVIVGPIKDSGDLSSTREALRKTGFREVIIQRY